MGVLKRHKNLVNFRFLLSLKNLSLQAHQKSNISNAQSGTLLLGQNAPLRRRDGTLRQTDETRNSVISCCSAPSSADISTLP